MGCDQGGSMEEDLSSDEAEDRIETALDNVSESMDTLEGGAFSTAFKEFLGLQNGEALSEEWADDLISELDAVFQTSNGRFEFDTSTGEYEWNSSSEQWSATGGANAVVLNFPASEATVSNNATFRLSQYSDVGVTVDGETEYLPRTGTASLQMDGTEIFQADLSDARYIEEQGLDPIPRSFDLEILTAPHTHKFELVENSSTDFDFSFELRNNDELVTGLDVALELASDDYSNLEGTDVDRLSGDLDIGPELTISYEVDVGELAALNDPSESQINDRIQATIESKGQRIGTLRYDASSEDVEIVYTDGSVDPASDFYEDLLDEMETVWFDYIGSGGIHIDAEAGLDLGALF